jgi:lipopolysaccharide/colanic/teichoic acid biosynthesis glycosyltransferase
MYCEDVDFCYRITQAGWKIYYVPESSIIHYKGESTKKNNLDYVLNFNRSLYIFYKKHFHKKYIAIIGWVILLGVFLRGVFIFTKNFLMTHLSYILDVLIINLVIFLTFIIRYEIKSGFSIDDFLNQYIVINVLATIIFSGAAISFDLYKRYKFSIIQIFKTNFLTFFILAALTFFMKQFAFSRMVVVISAFFSTLVMIGYRILIRRRWRGAQSVLGNSIMQRKTVLVGTDPGTEDLVNKMNNYIRTGFDLIGLVSLSPSEVGKKISGVPVVTSIDKMSEYVKIEKVNQVIFSTHSITYELIIRTMSRIEDTGVEYKIVPQNLEVIIGKSSVERFTEYQFVDIDYAIGKTSNRIQKRAFDIIISFIMLIISLPVWAIARIFRWKGKSKILIWGEKGQQEAIIQNKKNPFKGTLNRILLLYYIFMGRVSFVGAALKQISKDQPHYFYKPGLFGLAQLSQNGADTSIEEKKYDLYYLKNQNIWLDIEIILKSLFAKK